MCYTSEMGSQFDPCLYDAKDWASDTQGDISVPGVSDMWWINYDSLPYS